MQRGLCEGRLELVAAVGGLKTRVGRSTSLGVHKPTAYYVIRILLWR